MLAEERWQNILDLVNSQNIVSVQELSKRLGTSEVTIRRDLSELEEIGKLKRVHGGAMRNEQISSSIEPKFSQLANDNVSFKEQIADYAMGMIKDSTAIMLDASSTVLMLAQRIRKRKWKELTVVTNSVRVIMELVDCEGIELVLIGGQVRKNLVSCAGFLAEMQLKQLKVDISFLGINGIDLEENAMTTPNLSEAAIKRAMFKCTKKSIILADHSKFNRSYLGMECAASDVDLIITDDQVDMSIIRRAQEIGVELRIAPRTNILDA